MNHFFLTCPSQVTFPELLRQWFCDVSKLGEQDRAPDEQYIVLKKTYGIKITADQLAIFAQLFNLFVADLAHQGEQYNWWQSSHLDNIFTPFDITHGEQINGHAFVPQCREGVILCRLFFLNEQCNSARLTVYENATAHYKKANPSSAWAVLDNLFTQVFMLSSVLRLSLKGEDELLAQDFLSHLSGFDALYEKVNAFVVSDHHPHLPQDSAFYSISDEQLNQLSEEQLLCVCLEEINQKTITSLLHRILSTNELWIKVTAAFNNESFNHRVDNPINKMNCLLKFRSLIKLPLLPEHQSGASIGPNSDKNQDVERQLTQQLAEEKMIATAQAKQLAELQENEKALEISQQKSRLMYKQLHTNLLGYEQKFQQQAAQLVNEKKKHQQREDEHKELKIQYAQLKAQLDKSHLTLQQQQRILNKIESQLLQSMQREQKGQDEVQQLKSCLKNNSMLIKMKSQLADLSPLLYSIELIKKKKEELYQRKCTKAVQQAHLLITHLDDAINNYLKDDCTFEALKSQCLKHVHEAYPELAQWRGWKQILLNTLLCIAGLGVGYVVAGAINYTVNKQFTFFNNTQSADLLDDLSAFLKPIS